MASDKLGAFGDEEIMGEVLVSARGRGAVASRALLPARAEMLPDWLRPVYIFITSPVVIMLGAAVFLMVIALVLSPGDEREPMTEEERKRLDEMYMKQVGSHGAEEFEDGDEYEDEDEDEDEDDDEGIDEDGYDDDAIDPATGKVLKKDD